MVTGICSHKGKYKLFEKEQSYSCDRQTYKNDLCIFHFGNDNAYDSEDYLTLLRTLEEEVETAKGSGPTHVLDWRGFRLPFLELDGWVFPRTVLLGNAQFPCGLTLENCIFEGKVEAPRANFGKGNEALKIEKCHFNEAANFHYAIFCPSPSVTECTFQKEANFHNCKLANPAFFMNKFLGPLSFSGATFTGQCDFKICEFSERTNFFSITCSKKPSFDFRESTISGKFLFGTKGALNESCTKIDFGDITLEDRTNVVFNKIEACIGIFDRITQVYNATFTFNYTTLDRSTFIDTNIENFNFRDVKWCIFNNRDSLHSEQLLLNDISENNRTPAELLEIIELNAENYRQLVRNYEARRNFKMSQDFHIGEMEMQRYKGIVNANNSSKILKTLTSWNDFTLYKILSKYGTDYTRSLYNLGLLLIVIPIFFMFSGLAISESTKINNNTSLRKDIEYSLHANNEYRDVSFSEISNDYIRSLSFVLSTVTLQKEVSLRASNIGGELLRTLTLLLIPGQAALVFLSIRRKFKRSGGGE